MRELTSLKTIEEESSQRAIFVWNKPRGRCAHEQGEESTAQITSNPNSSREAWDVY